MHRNGFWDCESMTDTRYCIAASVLKPIAKAVLPQAETRQLAEPEEQMQ